MRLQFISLAILLLIPASIRSQTSAVEASEKALKRSQITLAGSKPFHLIANLTEKDSPDSDYQVRETWPQRTSTCFGEEHGRTELPPDRGKPGTESSINISVDETGKLTGAGPGRGTSDRAFFAMYGALTKWQFRPYLKDGKPQYFHGVLTLRLN